MAEAKRNDISDEKIPLHLLPTAALEEVGKVMAFGAVKYGEDNWMLGLPWRRTIGSCLRHIFLWVRGQDVDKESGLPHLAHAACNLLFILEWIELKRGKDDRADYKKA